MSTNANLAHGEQARLLVPHRSFLSWSAILAGLVVTIATTWLLSLLGVAIGASVLDGTDAEALGNGFGIGAAIWMLVSGLIAFFLGGLVVGRTCGQNKGQDGMIHGFTMWSTAAIMMMLLSYYGVSGLISTGANVVGNATRSIASATQSVPQIASAAANGGIERAQQQFNETRQSLPPQLKRELTSMAVDIKKQAAQTLADQSEGSASAETIENAMNQLNPDVVQQMALHYLTGEPQAAKDTLALNTDLNEQQINAMAASLETAVQDRVDEYQQQASEITETASTYAQSVLWTSVVTTLLGLIVAIVGGMLGSQTAVRREAEVVEREHRIAA